jgi:hypothetical protein
MNHRKINLKKATDKYIIKLLKNNLIEQPLRPGDCCYGLDVVCPPRASVLKAQSPVWKCGR